MKKKTSEMKSLYKVLFGSAILFKKTALSIEGFQGVHDLKSEFVGPNILHADFHIMVNGNISVEEANKIVEY